MSNTSPHFSVRIDSLFCHAAAPESMDIVERVRALEVNAGKVGSAVSGGGSDLEARLEALERDKLSSEMILHQVAELPNKDSRAVVAAVASMSLLQSLTLFFPVSEIRPRVTVLAV